MKIFIADIISFAYFGYFSYLAFNSKTFLPRYNKFKFVVEIPMRECNSEIF